MNATGTLVLSVLIVLAAPAIAQTGASPEQIFAEGNRLYEAGDYDGAIEAYVSLVREGAVDKDLFYNLGNAYYEIGSAGSAVLNYERALRLDPRHDDAAANLALTRLVLRDREFLQSEGLTKRIVLWVPRKLSTMELMILTSLFYLLLTMIVIGFIFRDTNVVSTLYRRVSLLSPGRLLGLEKVTDFALAGAMALMLLAATGAAVWGKYSSESHRLDAVVLQEELPVYGGPSTQATLQFKIHEGTVTRVVDLRPGWVEIELPGDLSGWVRAEALERI